MQSPYTALKLNDVFEWIIPKPDLTKFKETKDEVIHPMHYEAHLFQSISTQ